MLPTSRKVREKWGTLFLGRACENKSLGRAAQWRGTVPLAPQRLKPHFVGLTFGTTKVVPFPVVSFLPAEGH